MSGSPQAPALLSASVPAPAARTPDAPTPTLDPRRGPSTAWMDFARVAGMLAVVTVHVISPAMLHDVTDKNSGAWWTAAGINALTRFCVPIFIMISGALLLAPAAGLPVRTFYRRRLKRVGIPLAAWSAFYLGLRALTSPDGLTARQGAVDLATGKPYYHLYFLFVLAGLYVITPFLRLVVLNARPRMVGLFAAVLLAIGMADQALSMLLKTGQSNAVTQFLPYAGYFVAGWYLQQLPLTRRLVRVAAVAVVAGVALTTLGTWALMDLTPWADAYEYFVMPLSPSALMLALGAFVLFRALGQRASTLTRSATVHRLSALSFGVYLVHPAVLTQIRDRVAYPPTIPGVLVTGGAILAATLAASLAITALGRRIPGVRNVF